LLQKFDTWLKASGDSLGSLIDAPSPDVDRINTLPELYGRELFRAGRPYNHYAETLNGISSRRPRLRRSLQQAWNLAVSWLREEPGSHHVALPWQCLVALVTTSWMWGWIQVAGILALPWGGVTRIGEAAILLLYVRTCCCHPTLDGPLAMCSFRSPSQRRDSKRHGTKLHGLTNHNWSW